MPASRRRDPQAGSSSCQRSFRAPRASRSQRMPAVFHELETDRICALIALINHCPDRVRDFHELLGARREDPDHADRAAAHDRLPVLRDRGLSVDVVEEHAHAENWQRRLVADERAPGVVGYRWPLCRNVLGTEPCCHLTGLRLPLLPGLALALIKRLFQLPGLQFQHGCLLRV